MPPHRIFEIDEILRAIACCAGDINKATAISLACCCQAFEEPALSPIWSHKKFSELSMLLPSISTHDSMPTARPTEEEWKRFRRYASWIRSLKADTPNMTHSLRLPFLNLIASPPTDGPTQQATATVFPNLRQLKWFGAPSSLIYLPPFVTPILTQLYIYTMPRSYIEYPPGEYSPIAHVINSTLSPSILQCLHLYIHREASPELRQATADLVPRCGSTLKEFVVEFELPESAVLHLMSLPNLTIWQAAQPVPMALVSSRIRPSISLTRMRSLTLFTTDQRRWCSFIHDLVGERSYPPVPHPPTLGFGNLICFRMEPPKSRRCTSSCTIPLTDSDVSLLADALPRLEETALGRPCVFNTCQTTFRSLHTLSTRCPRLRKLRIHFNTTTLIQDIESISQEGNLPTENRKPRPGPDIGSRSYPLVLQCVEYLPIEATVGVDGLEVVARGLFDISIVINDGSILDQGLNSQLWVKVSKRIEAIRA